ncbi:unnamed protein product [Mortierella alpina]
MMLYKLVVLGDGGVGKVKKEEKKNILISPSPSPATILSSTAYTRSRLWNRTHPHVSTTTICRTGNSWRLAKGGRQKEKEKEHNNETSVAHTVVQQRREA